MQLREKLLATGFAAVIAIYFVPKMWSWFIDPVASAEAARKSAQTLHDGREMVQHGKEYVQTTSMSQMATDLKDVISKHPVYSAVIGLGLGYMIGRMLTGNNSRG